MKLSLLIAFVCTVSYVLVFFLLSPFFSYKSDKEFLALFTLPIGIFLFFFLKQKRGDLHPGNLLLFFATVWASSIAIVTTASLLEGSFILGEILYGLILVFMVVLMTLHICSVVLAFSRRKKYPKTIFILVNLYSIAFASLVIFIGWMIVGVGVGIGGVVVLIFPLVSGFAVLLAVLLTVFVKIKFSESQLFLNGDL